MVYNALGKLYTERILNQGLAETESFVVVHGAARGADSFASEWIKAMRAYSNSDLFVEERHYAHWDHYGKVAGLLRNQEMVDLGAEVCLAFSRGNSRGTADCIRRAQKAGIPVIMA